MSGPALGAHERQALAAAAKAGLTKNRVELPNGWAFHKASPTLYPHQWSWDAAFIAIGLSHVDVAQAYGEINALFRAQWADGRVPHIVFNPLVGADAYFPDAGRWASQKAASAAPRGVDTSGIVQPPVHALAVLAAVTRGLSLGPTQRQRALDFAADMVPKLAAWHRYLLTQRDPEASGLVTIVHPWESGMDNSPRWDAPLARVDVDRAALEPYTRIDLKRAKASHRPTNADYDRFVWLLQTYRDHGYADDVVADRSFGFLVKDVVISALLVRANEALAQLSHHADASAALRQEVETWVQRGRAGLERAWVDDVGGTYDFDARTQTSCPALTVGLFAPLIAGGLSAPRLQRQLDLLESNSFLGATELARRLVTSTSPRAKEFNPEKYWRGPSWPVLSLIVWQALERAREAGSTRAGVIADTMRDEALHQLSTSGFAEYFNPLTGEAIGSADQAWSQAAALEWLGASARK